MAVRTAASFSRDSISGVSVTAGATQLQRIPSFAQCTAIVFVSMATPAFATAYGWTGKAMEAFSPRTERMLTIEPPPCRCM